MDNGWYHARITWCITIFIADFFFSFFLLRSTSPTSWRACFPPSPPRYADRPIAALDQGRIYFTSFSPRFYVRTTIEFIRESVEFQSSSVPDPISRSIIHIYIDSFFETVYCFPPNILPHLYILFLNRRLRKIQRRRRIIIDHLLSCPRNWMKNWGISQRCVTLRYVTSYVTSLRYIARHRRETQATCVYPLLYLIIRHNAMTDVK